MIQIEKFAPKQATNAGEFLDHHTSGSSNERGFTLITVLWTVSLLTLIASVFIAAARSHVQVTTNAQEAAAAAALAEAGLQLAILDLIDAQREPARRRFALAGATACTLAGQGTLTIGIADEGGKLDLNFTESAQFQRLFEGLGYGAADALRFADIIADYRDPDDRRRPNGAERADYLAAGRAMGPANGPFVAVEELGRLPGFPADLAARLQRLSTVHSGTGSIDLALAPAELAAALATVGGALAPPAGGTVPSGRNAFAIMVNARTEQGAGATAGAVIRLRPDGRPAYKIERWMRRGAPGRVENMSDPVRFASDPC